MNPYSENKSYMFYPPYPMSFYQMSYQQLCFPYFSTPTVEQKTMVNNPIEENFTKIKYEENNIEKKDENNEKESQKCNLNLEQKQNHDQLYNPKVKNKSKKVLKVYEKDDKRNIIPNIINQIFSFLNKKFKSEKILSKLVKQNPHLNLEENILHKYYLYQKFLKTKLSRYLNETSLKLLFEPIDPLCEFYSLENQNTYIRINIVLIRYFLSSQIHLIQVLSGKRIGRDKIKTYLNAFKRIKSFIFDEIEKLKQKTEKDQSK